jgi:hypothetical protein
MQNVVFNSTSYMSSCTEFVGVFISPIVSERMPRVDPEKEHNSSDIPKGIDDLVRSVDIFRSSFAGFNSFVNCFAKFGGRNFSFKPLPTSGGFVVKNKVTGDS